MGGDSAGVEEEGLSIDIGKDKKVFIKGSFIIGFTTSFRMGQLLQYSLEVPEKIGRMSDERYMNTVFVDCVRSCFRVGGFLTSENGSEVGGNFLVGYNKRVYEIEPDFHVRIPSNGYYACGCGRDLCLGSLFSTKGKRPQDRIKMALNAAARFSAGVRGPFTIKCL
jgi:hypothetical protein